MRRSPRWTISSARARSATIGHSNLAGWQIAEADFVAASPRASRSSPRRTTTACSRAAPSGRCCPAVERFGLGFFPFFPLHNGLLTGKFTRDRRSGGQPHHDAASARLAARAVGRARERTSVFCDERGITMLEATFGWLLVAARAVRA